MPVPVNHTWLSLFVAGALIVKISKHHRPNAIDFVSMILLLLVSFVLIKNVGIRGDFIDQADNSYTDYVRTVIVQSVVFYLIGRSFLLDSLRRQFLLMSSFIFLLLFVLLNSRLQPLA